MPSFEVTYADGTAVELEPQECLEMGQLFTCELPAAVRVDGLHGNRQRA
jgi:hypothetical protein